MRSKDTAIVATLDLFPILFHHPDYEVSGLVLLTRTGIVSFMCTNMASIDLSNAL